MKPKSRIVFLDRDGTLNVDYGYVTAREDLDLIPCAAGAVALLKRAGFLTVVVTNQSAVGRGMANLDDVADTNAALREKLLAGAPEAVLDEILFCPHAPEDHCACRKPATGMLEKLRGRIEFDPKESWVVGDKEADLEFGAAAGIPQQQRILVRTGAGKETERNLKEAGKAPVVCDDLLASAKLIARV